VMSINCVARVINKRAGFDDVLTYYHAPEMLSLHEYQLRSVDFITNKVFIQPLRKKAIFTWCLSVK